MSIYLMLTTLTDSGRKALQEDPEILKEINKEVEFMGVKVLTQYALLGQYDFVNILEAPSNEAIAKLAIASLLGASRILTKSYWPSRAYWVSTLTPINSTSLLISLSISGSSWRAFLPESVRVVN